MLINRVKIVFFFLAIAGSCGAFAGLAVLPIKMRVNSLLGVDVSQTKIDGYKDSGCLSKTTGTIWNANRSIFRHLVNGTHTYHLATSPGNSGGPDTSLSQIACQNGTDGYMKLISIILTSGHCNIISTNCIHATCADATDIISVDTLFEANCSIP